MAYPYPQQPGVLRSYPGAINAQQIQSGNAATMVEDVAVDIPPAQPVMQRATVRISSTAALIPNPVPVVAPVAVVAPVEPCPPQTCWSRQSSATIGINVLMFLMLVAVVILLFVVDLSTNQIADTALIAVTILLGAVSWYMNCDCGASIGPNGACLQVPGGCSSVLA
jgi:hypothetical protein